MKKEEMSKAMTMYNELAHGATTEMFYGAFSYARRLFLEQATGNSMTDDEKEWTKIMEMLMTRVEDHLLGNV